MEENNTIQNEEGKKDVKAEESDLEQFKKQAEEYLGGWKRAKADLINYKKDEFQRLEEVAKFAGEDLIRELITILDSFDLSIVAMEKTQDGKVEKGVYLIRLQLEDLLKKRGLERIKAKVGDAFNPALHEAIGTMASEGPEGTIAEEVERGYALHGKVLRPARVKVSKGKLKD